MSIWASHDLYDERGQQRQARAVHRDDTDGYQIDGDLPLLLDVASGGLDGSIRVCAWEDDPFYPVVELMLPRESAATLRDLLDKALTYTAGEVADRG